MHHALSKTRLFGDKNQQRYMSTLIHYTTTEQGNRLMRPKTDNTNNPTKVNNTKICGKHKYLLLVYTKTSIYVPLYGKREHRVLQLIGWPLSNSLQLKRFLNFSPGIHRNAQR